MGEWEWKWEGSQIRGWEGQLSGVQGKRPKAWKEKVVVAEEAKFHVGCEATGGAEDGRYGNLWPWPINGHVPKWTAKTMTKAKRRQSHRPVNMRSDGLSRDWAEAY